MAFLADTSSMMETELAPSPTSYANHSTTWTPSSETVPISTNPSRKRSRDESAFETAEAENSYFSMPAVNPPEPIPEEEPIYGEGMVLLSPKTGRPIAQAESQTGTWYEEKVEQEALIKKAEAESRPRMPVGRKSVRLSQSSIRAALSLAPNVPASPPKSAPITEIDEATLALGIGWTKMSSEDPDLQAAARGWARYLEVHYSRHIHGAELLLKNTSLDAYLIGCQEGFFLFQEDLLRGQLVGSSWDAALQNLKAQPMRFEGTEVLQAERTPGPDFEVSTKDKEQINSWQDWNRINQQAAAANGASGMDLD